jgi:hypothetical protein
VQGGYLLQGIVEVTDDLRKKKVGTEGFSSPIIVSFVAEAGVEYSSTSGARSSRA